MRASFSNEGHLVLHPETALERMAAKAFVQSMRHRNKPQILIDAGDGSAVPQGKNSVSLIAQEAEVHGEIKLRGDDVQVSGLHVIPGQQQLDEVARSVGGV